MKSVKIYESIPAGEELSWALKHHDIHSAERGLAGLYYDSGKNYHILGKYAEAEKYFKKFLDIHLTLREKNDEEFGGMLKSIGDACAKDKLKLKVALTWYKRAMDIFKLVYGEESEKVAHLANLIRRLKERIAL